MVVQIITCIKIFFDKTLRIYAHQNHFNYFTILLAEHIMVSLYTNTSRSDGFGAQIREIFFSIVWTLIEHKGEFVYTPITRMEHNYNNNKDWIKNTNDFLNITSQFNKCPNNSVKKSRYDKNKMTRNMEKYIHSPAFEKIRDCITPNMINPYDHQNYFNIAIHLRRKNAHDNLGPIKPRLIPDDYFNSRLQNFFDDYQKRSTTEIVKPLRIYIYTQGNEDVKLDTKGHEVINCIDIDVYRTFAGFVYADALITSLSLLSYMAAFFNKGDVYHIDSTEYCGGHMAHWKTCKKDYRYGENNNKVQKPNSKPTPIVFKNRRNHKKPYLERLSIPFDLLCGKINTMLFDLNKHRRRK